MFALQGAKHLDEQRRRILQVGVEDGGVGAAGRVEPRVDGGLLAEVARERYPADGEAPFEPGVRRRVGGQRLRHLERAVARAVVHEDQLEAQVLVYALEELVEGRGDLVIEQREAVLLVIAGNYQRQELVVHIGHLTAQPYDVQSIFEYSELSPGRSTAASIRGGLAADAGRPAVARFEKHSIHVKSLRGRRPRLRRCYHIKRSRVLRETRTVAVFLQAFRRRPGCLGGFPQTRAPRWCRPGGARCMRTV